MWVLVEWKRPSEYQCTPRFYTLYTCLRRAVEDLECHTVVERCRCAADAAALALVLLLNPSLQCPLYAPFAFSIPVYVSLVYNFL